jgi:hypothetical protein
MGIAINTACKLITDRAVVWQIKGSDGFVMERRDIEEEFARRQGEGYRSAHGATSLSVTGNRPPGIKQDRSRRDCGENLR